MELNGIKNLTISDFIEFAPFMKLPLREAVPKIKEYLVKRGLPESEHRHIASVVRALGLYR